MKLNTWVIMVQNLMFLSAAKNYFIAPLNSELGSEWGQTISRFICSVALLIYLLVYFIFFETDIGNANIKRSLIGGAAYFLFSVIWIGVLRASRFNKTIRWRFKNKERQIQNRLFFSIVLDQAIFCLIFFGGGEVFAPLVWAPLGIAIGNGLRFGYGYARTSATLGSFLLLAAMLNSPYWERLPALSIGLAASIMLIPWYAFHIVESLKSARERAESSAIIARELAAKADADAVIAKMAREKAEADAITAKVEAAKHKKAAETDNLTGVLSLAGLMPLLEDALEKVESDARSCAVMFLDLDGFKKVNDSGGGHAAGDKALIDFVSALRKSVRKSDPIGRVGGDEFMIMINNFSTDEEVKDIARKILASVAEIRIPSVPEFGVSIGVVFMPAPDVANNYLAVKAAADRLMYKAKYAGKNQFMTSR